MSTPAAAAPRGKSCNPIALAYQRLLHTVDSLQTPFLLLVRLYWGWQFAQTGWGKLQHLPRVAHYFGTLGLPAPGPTAAFVSGLEFVGGILFIVGFGTRVTALLLAVDMIVAYIATDLTALASILSDPDKFYGDAAYTFLIASLILLIFGPGRVSVDYRLFRRREY